MAGKSCDLLVGFFQRSPVLGFRVFGFRSGLKLSLQNVSGTACQKRFS